MPLYETRDAWIWECMNVACAMCKSICIKLSVCESLYIRYNFNNFITYTYNSLPYSYQIIFYLTLYLSYIHYLSSVCTSLVNNLLYSFINLAYFDCFFAYQIISLPCYSILYIQYILRILACYLHVQTLSKMADIQSKHVECYYG